MKERFDNQKFFNKHLASEWINVLSVYERPFNVVQDAFRINIDIQFGLKDKNINLGVIRQQQSGAGSVLPRLAPIFEEVSVYIESKKQIPKFNLRKIKWWEFLFIKKQNQKDNKYLIKKDGMEVLNDFLNIVFLKKCLENDNLKSICTKKGSIIELKYNTIFRTKQDMKLVLSTIDEMVFILEDRLNQ